MEGTTATSVVFQESWQLMLAAVEKLNASVSVPYAQMTIEGIDLIGNDLVVISERLLDCRNALVQQTAMPIVQEEAPVQAPAQGEL